MNAIPGKFGGKLASLFLLVHGSGHDERTWFPLFSVCNFHHECDGDIPHSHCQSHTMDGIAIGCSPTSNELLVYNPRTKRYYEPDSYRLDPYRLPSSVYPSLKYDGGLFCSLLRDENVPTEEPYPPGTRVERLDPFSNMLLAGTVMNIPLSLDSSGSPSYHICSTMALRLLFHFRRWPRLSRRLLLRLRSPRFLLTMVLQTFSLLSSRLTVGLLMNTTVAITKGSSLASLAVCIGSVSKPM
jgi:hypothetical protein